MAVRRMLPFLLLNVLVSATVVLALLFWWDSRQPDPTPAPTQVALARVTPTAAISENPEEAAEPAEEAEDETVRYTVRPGDTLGTISQQFDVPIEDIMLVNQMDDPDVLQVNQELIIPVGGIPTATPQATATAEASVLPTPIATLPADEGEAVVEITELIGVGSLADEAVSVVNSGDRPIALLGWRLLDEQGAAYTFGQVTLFGEGAAILVHTEAGQDGPADLYWGLEQPVWSVGETVTLVDAEGTVRATLVVSG